MDTTPQGPAKYFIQGLHLAEYLSQKVVVTCVQDSLHRLRARMLPHWMSRGAGPNRIGFVTSTPTTQCNRQRCNNTLAHYMDKNGAQMLCIHGLRAVEGVCKTMSALSVSLHVERGDREERGTRAIAQMSATQRVSSPLRPFVC